MSDRVRTTWDQMDARKRLVVGIVLFAVIVAVIVVVIVSIWPWLGMPESEQLSSNGDKLRNMALTLAAAIGLPLAIWRNIIANSQAKTAEQEHRDGRFEKGADMLGSALLATRMGGIAALNRLAETHPEDYQKQVEETLDAFARSPPEDKVLEEISQPTPDQQEAPRGKGTA